MASIVRVGQILMVGLVRAEGVEMLPPHLEVLVVMVLLHQVVVVAVEVAEAEQAAQS